MKFPKKYKAYVLTNEGKLIKKLLPLPKDLPEGYALLRIMGASVCGTDLGILKGKEDPWTVKNVFPKMVEGHDLVFGHEFYGEIVKTGANSRLEIGQIGACESHYPGPECVEKGIDGHTCKNYGIFGIWGHKNEDGTYAPCLGGGYAEYVVIPELNFYPVGELYKTFHCSLIEPLGNTWKIIEDLKNRGLPKTLLIIGSGPHSMNLQVFAKVFGVSKIAVTEPDDYRRGFTRGMGAATHILKPENLTNRVVDKITAGKGFDAVIDMVGVEKALAPIIKNDFIKENGIICLFGLPKEKDRVVQTLQGDVDMSDFIFQSMETDAKTPTGRDYKIVGYTGRTDHALKSLIKALNDKDKGNELQELLQKQLHVVGPLDELEKMVHAGFPKNHDPDDLKIGFTSF